LPKKASQRLDLATSGSCGPLLLNKNSSASFSHHFLLGLDRIEQGIAGTFCFILENVEQADLWMKRYGVFSPRIVCGVSFTWLNDI
jgi:hypothetical protein